MEKIMRNNHQQGFTLIGLIIVFGIIGVLTLSVMKVFPVYMDHLAVSKSLEALENDPKLGSMTTRKIRDILMKKLDVNAVTVVKGKDIKIKRGVSEIDVQVAYEVRKDYFSNIDIVLTFSDGFTADVK